ncbi:hypothetical protein NQ315_002535 [Exocentrus adspersus]|uniref:DUF4817 domain-containing protein n=1 Tax=Exocentrus adspersus TaxID=1586481 RepID=A0AAV8VF19_9CUCU|nr:hypothetical protein NQ315_002535 [Exocentrus adspersus]
MDRLSEKERIEILMILGYGDVRRRQQETCNIFNNLYPNRNPITRSTVSKLLKKFNQTGAIKDLSKSGRIKTATTEDKSLDVCVMLEDDPHLSTRQISRELDISQTSIMKILHDNKFHPYKVRLVQELSDDDFDRREEFADTMMEKCYDQNNPNFLNNVMFSDVATFCIDGNNSIIPELARLFPNLIYFRKNERSDNNVNATIISAILQNPYKPKFIKIGQAVSEIIEAFHT